MVAADRNGVELRCVLHAKVKGVDHQPHRRLGRIDVFLLGDVFLQDVILQSARDFLPIRSLFFRDGEVHRPDDRRWGIDGHRGGDVGERNLVEEHFHIGEGTDGHAAFADFALGKWMVGVIAHQGGEIEGGREAGLALCQKVSKALVGVLRRPKTGKLAHRPKPPAMHSGVNAACVGRLPGKAKVAVRVPAGEISRRVKTLDWKSRNGGEFRLALGALFQCGAKRIFFPCALFRRGLARHRWSVGGCYGRCGSFDPFAHCLTPPFAPAWTECPKERRIPCYAKAKSGARGLAVDVSREGKSEAGRFTASNRPRKMRLPFAPI